MGKINYDFKTKIKRFFSKRKKKRKTTMLLSSSSSFKANYLLLNSMRFSFFFFNIWCIIMSLIFCLVWYKIHFHRYNNKQLFAHFSVIVYKICNNFCFGFYEIDFILKKIISLVLVHFWGKKKRTKLIDCIIIIIHQWWTVSINYQLVVVEKNLSDELLFLKKNKACFKQKNFQSLMLIMMMMIMMKMQKKIIIIN